MRRLLLAALIMLAAPAAAQASPLTHETIRLKDYYVATKCSHRAYDWIGEIQATVNGRYAGILYGSPVEVFWADHNRVIGEVSWHPGTRVCMTVYDLGFQLVVRVRLQIQDARVIWPDRIAFGEKQAHIEPIQAG